MSEYFTIKETEASFGTDRRKGLTEEEAAERLAQNGRNELKAPREKTLPEAFLEQLNDPLIYVLIAAAVISVILGSVSDAVIIGVVVCMNAAVGLIQEGRARKALDALKQLTSPRTIVLRGGTRREIPAAELVTGDLVCLETGCQVPADLRLVYTGSLKTEESALTGESLPIEKDALFTAKRKRSREGKETELPLGDRKNMAFMSTIVTCGKGEGIVTAVGMDTEIGRIASFITQSKEELTPLQKRLGELGKVLSVLSLVLCVALFGLAVFQRRNVLEMLITAISLAVAAVPEGLPAVVTICLALSVTRMVKVHAIVRRLPCVETLGAVSVVCSDKTGTLTQNKMTVETCYVNGKEYGSGSLPARQCMVCGEFLQGLTLCNDAHRGEGSAGAGRGLGSADRTGDPTELALLDLAAGYGIRKAALERQFPRRSELAFDSDRKMMTTVHRTERGEVAYTKGAPDEVLKKCTSFLRGGQAVPLAEGDRFRFLKAAESMSAKALRVLAVARRVGGGPIEENLTFLGMAGMKDPPRREAAQAVAAFREAGVATVMITGDHIETAFAVGRQLGIVKHMDQCMTGAQLQAQSGARLLEKLDRVRVFARVSPAQKMDLVKGFQEKGQIVAMTGDGVNDAPSLKAADIGIAMGRTGTDVAKQAADMILTDDHFATIEKAIEEGRGVYENIRKSVIFLLSSNLGEIMTMFFAVLCGLASPLQSSHILWINLITDSLPALALGMDANDGKALMRNKPRRPEESLFSRGGLACTCFYGVLIAGISLTAFLLLPCGILREKGLSVNLAGLAVLLKNDVILAKSQTYAFTVLGMSQLFHAVGMRDTEKSVFRMKLLENKLMLVACGAGFFLQFAVTEAPFLLRAFGTSHLALREWVRLGILAAAPMLAHQCLVFFSRERVRPAATKSAGVTWS
jgi:Ca2+-transporting ATPase